MPTINVTIAAGPSTIGNVKQITGPDLQRFVTAQRAAFGQVPSGTSNPDGTPIYRDMTDEEVIQLWSNNVITNIKHVTKKYEKEAAARAAADNVEEIPIT